MKSDEINPEIRNVIEAELLAEEELLWVGQPSVRRMMRNPVRSRTPKIISVLVALGLAVFIGAAVRVGASGRIAIPFMILTMIVLLALVAGIAPILSALLTARRTIYAVTDRRVLIVSGKSVQSYGESDIELVERTIQRGDTGDIVFRYEQRTAPVFYGNGFYGRRDMAVPVGFFGIKHVREVEALLLETFRSAGAYTKPKRDEHDEPERVYLDTEGEFLAEDGRR